MNKTRISVIAIAALASSLFVAPALAQNLPPPGNVNPGSPNSGAEESGAENQPRSFDNYGGPRGNYGGTSGYAVPYESTVTPPALGYAPSRPPMPQGAPIYGADE